MTFKHVTATTVFLIFVCSSISVANNNLFLPGDAFFPAQISAENMAAFSDSPNDFTFEYSSLGGYGGAFCGYAGYQSATLPDVDAAFAANLKIAYEKIREHDPRQLVETKKLDDEANETGELILTETNPVGVMFYNHAFDVDKFKLALRYNEDWVKETVSFGHQADHVRLCPLVSSSKALALSWRDAAKVEPLKVTFPALAENGKPSSGEPVAIQGTPKAIVFAACSPEVLFDDPKSVAIFVVDAKGVRKMFPDKQGSSNEGSSNGKAGGTF